jgi:hypothetical protein
MHSEDDTFRKLARCTFMELRNKILISGYTYPHYPERSRIIVDNLWTVVEYETEWAEWVSRGQSTNEPI